MNESEYVPKLIECIEKQSFKDFELYACVNQLEHWWEDAEKQNICIDNAKTIEILTNIKSFEVEIIDRSSKGNGWDAKNFGVGWARKTVMDKIASIADDKDIIICLDGDISFNDNYFQSVIDAFEKAPKAMGMTIPYYHKLTNDNTNNKALLRYEIYMRNYELNMWKIKSPYSYTAIGSAMACPVWAYKKVRGIAPKTSGEDFYFLQKLRKAGSIIVYNHEKIYPSSRLSDRVFFGTGPALIKGTKGDWSSYPIYHYSLFKNIKKLYDSFSLLFTNDIKTPLDAFIQECFGENIWNALRKNYKTEEAFVKACHHKIDGLRILQYLKSEQKKMNIRDEQALQENIAWLFPKKIIDVSINNGSVESLNIVRDFMAEEEMAIRIVVNVLIC